VTVSLDWHRALLVAALVYVPMAVLLTVAKVAAGWDGDRAIGYLSRGAVSPRRVGRAAAGSSAAGRGAPGGPGPTAPLAQLSKAEVAGIGNDRASVVEAVHLRLGHNQRGDR
jgi:hypothetical protein